MDSLSLVSILLLLVSLSIISTIGHNDHFDYIHHGKSVASFDGYGSLEWNKLYDNAGFNITMAGAKSTQASSHLATAYKLFNFDVYIMEFWPYATDSVHHMVVYGCNETNGKGIWSPPDNFPCSSAANGRLLFAWGHNQAKFILPRGVGVKIGPASGTPYIAIVVHYTKPVVDDKSGMEILVTKLRRKNVAEISKLKAEDVAAPPSTPPFQTDMECTYTGKPNIFPLAVRTDANPKGTKTSVYVYQGNWTLLKTLDPQKPPAFHSVNNKVVMAHNDIIFVRSTFKSAGHLVDTHISQLKPASDESSVYVMYYRSNDGTAHTNPFQCTHTIEPQLLKTLPPAVPPKVASGNGMAAGTTQKGPGYQIMIWPGHANEATFELHMPGATPRTDNSYLHTAFKLPDLKLYIVGYTALANAKVAHHMLIFGCHEIGGTGIWRGSECKSGRRIIFAWAKNAPHFDMPKDVGEPVGVGTNTRYIVVQIHYKNALPASAPPDKSGIKVTLTKTVPKYQAGILLLVTGGFILPQQEVAHLDLSCEFEGKTEIHPFAVRVHAHELARVISGYVYHDNGTWELIHKGNPQWPQAFYPMNHKMVIKPKAKIFGRCTYNSMSRSNFTLTGSTGKDEMCNMYIMYYTDSKKGSLSNVCSGKRFPKLMRHIPSDSDKPLPPNPLLDAMAHGNNAMASKKSLPTAIEKNTHKEPEKYQTIKWPGQANEATFDLRMPGATPDTDNMYLHTAFKLPDDLKLYIVGYTALANANVAHHMLIYGCQDIGGSGIWQGGECKGGGDIIFAWAKNAPHFDMPKDVGEPVGKGTNARYIVVEIHYKNALPAGAPPDRSGIKVTMTKTVPKNKAGILFLGSGGDIPPHRQVFHMDESCQFNGKTEIHPFAVRVHAHELARVISGYVYHDNGTWELIHKGNPQWPQAFYPIKHKMVIKPKAKLFVRCTYNSTSRSTMTFTGSTGKDEMCNFYIMYYTDSKNGSLDNGCGRPSFPELISQLPSDSDKPLPPNPLLDAVAHGNNAMGSKKSLSKTTKTITHKEPEKYQTIKWPGQANEATFELRMPGATPHSDNTYLHTAFKLPDDLKLYIVGYSALTTSDVAHHMLIYGCTAIGGTKIWEGDECKYGKSILFAWAKNAPHFNMPKDVGSPVGVGTKTQYIVVQIHYKHALSAGEPPDRSGIKVTMTKTAPIYKAGILLMLSGGSIPPHKEVVHLDISCVFSDKEEIHPFAVRVHAHELARVISGYVLHNGKWALIHKGNPQWPQAFYPIKNKHLVIKPQDKIFARCTYNSTERSTTTYIGPTGKDEMCNMYVMYYTDMIKGVVYSRCGGNHFPRLMHDLPPGNDVPLPPNPLLDSMAHGHHHMKGSKKSKPTSTTNANVLPEIKEVKNWPKENLTLGQVGGLATDSHGNVWIFHRGDTHWDYNSFDTNDIYQYQNKPVSSDPIVVLSPDGKFLEHGGKNEYYLPHGITIDHEDNIWLTDVALHQVLRIPWGKKKPNLILGEKFKPGKDKKHFCKPADVAVMKNGVFFVADGYCNSRIVKFDKTGKYLAEWGKSSSDLPNDSYGYPPKATFAIVHSVIVAEDKGLVCAADRENGRIQCFDLDGHFMKEIRSREEIGLKLYAIDYTPMHGGLLFAVNGGSSHNQGLVIKLDTGAVVGHFNSKQHPFGVPHDVTFDSKYHSVYVGGIEKNRVWKFNMIDQPQVVVSAAPTTTKSVSTHSYTDVQNENVNVGGTPETDIPIDDKATVNHEGTKKAQVSQGISIIIACLLVIPISILILATIAAKVYKGKGTCCKKTRNKSRVFKMGTLNYFNSHKGFNKLSTEDSDHEVDPLHDSDEDQSAPRINSKM